MSANLKHCFFVNFSVYICFDGIGVDDSVITNPYPVKDGEELTDSKEIHPIKEAKPLQQGITDGSYCLLNTQKTIF